MVTMCHFNGNHQILTVSKSGKSAVKGLDDLKAFFAYMHFFSHVQAWRDFL